MYKMDPKKREQRIVEIMGEILNELRDGASLSLDEISEEYRSSEEAGLCHIAFSRLEAEEMIEKDSEGEWLAAGDLS